MTQQPSTQTKTAYTLGELMVAAAAREIRDEEIVFVGMRLPLIAFVVAKQTHAPNAVGLFENGVIRTTPSPELIYTMADPPNIKGATQCLDMLSVMSLLQSGKVDLGFLGAAEVDRFGNLNSTEVRGDKNMSACRAQVARAISPPLRKGLLSSWSIRSGGCRNAFPTLPVPATVMEQDGESGLGFRAADRLRLSRPKQCFVSMQKAGKRTCIRRIREFP